MQSLSKSTISFEILGEGGGVSVISNVVHFFTKKWKNCIYSLVLSLFLEKNNGNLFSPIGVY